MSTVSKVASLLPVVEQYVQSRGGNQALGAAVEWPRMLLLIEACRTEDAFFLVLHQLFSLWSIRPQDTYNGIPLSQPMIDRAFSILESVLKKNQAITLRHQVWFAQFPVADGRFAQANLGDPALLTQIATFLASLVNDYQALLIAALHRKYPFLVDELLSRLSCYSPVLQYTLFTACRRHLGVPDNSFATQLEQSFREDQQRHRSPVTGFHVLAPVTQPRDIECRNAPLINYYTLLVDAATPRPTIQPPAASVPRSSPSISAAQHASHADHLAPRPSVQHHQTTPATSSMPSYPHAVAHNTANPQFLATPGGRALQQLAQQQ
ncbi:hypothetical protein C8A05DRAFT_39845, partial [Staphylotrichum tortipilum]